MDINMEELGLRKLPDLELAQLRFLVSKGNEEAKGKLLALISERNMAPFYSSLCEQFKWKMDMDLLVKMQTQNEEDLKEIHRKLDDAQQNLGENEVREAMLARADHFAEIGAKAAAIKAYRIAYDKTVPLGQRMDVVFALIRIGFFFEDHDLIKRNVDKAASLLEEGGDWDRKNRLKAYEAMYWMSIREFSKAAKLFLDTLSTFTSYELFDYNTFIFYTVITSILTLSRTELKSKVIDSPEVLGVISDIPHLGKFLNSLYNSEYSDFFVALADILDRINQDRYLAKHATYYCREMRIKAYNQILESYRSVQLPLMATQFGISVEYLDRELSRFIASGRLHCKIDKVGGIVETTRPDSKNAQYQATIKQGDLLLNRIQKLSRVINV